MDKKFRKSFTQQEPISEEAIKDAINVMRSGRIHRYNILNNERSQVSLLEKEFAEFTGARYCLAVTSGGYALSTALRASGVSHGDKVFTNSFSLAPVIYL